MNRIKQLRKKNGLTLSKLAEKVHIATNTLNQYELGKRQPNFEIMSTLAEFFDVSIEFLMGNKELNIDNASAYSYKTIKIPLLGIIPAGTPIEAIEEVLDYIDIPSDWSRSGKYFGLKVKGDSMSPTVNDGDIVIIRQQEDADTGKICVVMINGYDATLKRIKKDPNGLWVIPDNPFSDFKTTFFTNQEIIDTPVRILGIAVEVRRSL